MSFKEAKAGLLPLLTQKINIMKTFNKSFLPDEIIYNGEKYVLNSQISSAMSLSKTNPKTIIESLKKQGKKGVLVQVLSNKLKGKSDLYGNEYKPTKWIFTNQY